MRADRPVTRVDFVNLQPEVVPDAPDPQPDNHELARAGAIALGDMLIACSRSLVEQTLRNAEVFSSADLVDQGNIRPLIPLAIDPPDHVRYRRLLDPLFAPRQIDRLEADIAMRANHFIDRFVDRGECNFTAEFAELFPSSVFLGMMGLAWDELDTLVALRDGILRPVTTESTPEERTRIQRETAQRVYAYFVMVNLSSANLDSELYTDPLDVRFDREANPHLAFGGGVHRCLGSSLARRELRVALREWHRRIPEYSLAPGYRPAYKPPLRFVPNLQLVWPT